MNNGSIILQGLPEGSALAQEYVIEKTLGTGGFSITYKARHATREQYYAIKEFFINGYCSRNMQHNTIQLHEMQTDMYDKFKQQFWDEAQMMAKLNHPNIVKVLDIFEENGTFYTVMPFMNGETLQSIVDREGKLPYEIGVNYIAQVCEALNYIHAHDILHRDVKPNNIMITPEEKVVLLDFGAAREVVHDDLPTYTSALSSGYAPLEQYSKISRKGAYTDLYALGAVFYFIITGQKPMEATDRIEQELVSPVNFVPDLPDYMSQIILKAMALKPENRYQSVGELMYELTESDYWKQPETVNKKSVPKKMMTTIIVAAIVLLFAGGGIWYFLHNKSQKESIETPQTLDKEQNIEKRALLDETVDNLRVCLYDGKIYLRPTSENSKLDPTFWYVPGDSAFIANNLDPEADEPLPLDSLLTTIAALPDNLEQLFQKDSVPPGCTYYLYSGKMNAGYPDDAEGEAIYDCGENKFSYKGIFRKGLKEGEGVCTYSDGEGFKDMTFSGVYKDDKPVRGTLKYKDADNNEYMEDGTWKNETLYNGTIKKNGAPIIKYENGKRIKL